MIAPRPQGRIDKGSTFSCLADILSRHKQLLYSYYAATVLYFTLKISMICGLFEDSHDHPRLLSKKS